MVIWVSLYTVEVYYLHPDLNDERKTSPYQVVFPSENWIPLPAGPEERFFKNCPPPPLPSPIGREFIGGLGTKIREELFVIHPAQKQR
jgi:hypothetical protein